MSIFKIFTCFYIVFAIIMLLLIFIYWYGVSIFALSFSVEQIKVAHAMGMVFVCTQIILMPTFVALGLFETWSKGYIND